MNTTQVLSLIIAIAIAGLSGRSYADDYRYTRHRAPSHEQVRTAFNELEQYGTWYQLERDGIGWCPTVATRTRNWNPYHSDGSWIFPEGNRQWRSYHDWGHIVFNTEEGAWRRIYGVWYWIPERGWRGFKQPITRVSLHPSQYNPYRSDRHQDYPYTVRSLGNRIPYRDSTRHKKSISYRNSSHHKKSISYRNSTRQTSSRIKDISPAHEPRYKTYIDSSQPYFKEPTTSKAKPLRSVHPTPPGKDHDQENPKDHDQKNRFREKDHDQKDRSREQEHFGGDRKHW